MSSSQNGTPTKVKMLCSDGEVVVRRSSEKGLQLHYVDENGSSDQTEEIFMYEHTCDNGGKVQVSFHFCYEGACYGLNRIGDNLKLENVSCKSKEHSTYLIKFERERLGGEYTLKTVGNDPRYLYKPENSLHATFSADKWVEWRFSGTSAASSATN